MALGTRVPVYAGVPTPDPPHHSIEHTAAGTVATHTVAAGETLGMLAQRYGTTVEDLMKLNGLGNPDLLQVGQALQVPGTDIQNIAGPEFKVVPDSELVYGPGAIDFDARAFATGLNGFLAHYQEEVEGQMMDGPAILQLVADRHNVNPRLLLALLEHQAGWVTEASPAARTSIIGRPGSGLPGLYGELSWAANQLNLGFYGRAEGGLQGTYLGSDTQIAFSPAINDGTAGIQQLFAAVDGATPESWQRDVGPEGLYATYMKLFGNPFAYGREPIAPEQLEAVSLSLPWPAGESWYFTGGPHGAWNTGSAWGALDFVPPSAELGCVQSDAWVTAMADGVVTRSGNGAVVVDLDGDGFAGTGWAITYMHLETRDRVPLGQAVRQGDRLGHPSCEGGFSNGTHVHVARSFDGRWISADSNSPFVLSGWVSSGTGVEYDGYLTRGEIVKEACVCREDINVIQHAAAQP